MIRRAAMECDAPGYNKHLSHVHCLGNRLPEEVGSCVHFTTGYGVVRVDLFEDPGLVCHTVPMISMITCVSDIKP